MTPSDQRVRRVSFGRLPGFPELYRTYCTEYGRLADFYAGDWRRLESFRRVAERVDRQSHARGVLADLLQQQQRRWGDCAAQRRNVEALRREGTLAVVTGQQLGLFGGPLYTLYKALTAVRLARRLARDTGRQVVPVFWLEGADHDLDEVAHAHLVLGSTLLPVRYGGHALPEGGNLGAVGRLRFTADIERAGEEVLGALPPSEFRGAVHRDWIAPYREGATFVDAFAKCLSGLFGARGLVLMDPEEEGMKGLAAPLFQREIDGFAESHTRLAAASEKLSADFHVQVRPRATNLFYTDESGRHAVLPGEDGFVLRGSGRRMSREDLMGRPAALSPNVALRPLVQDTLLPTVAYVAGPGEVSYFAQLKGLYEWAGVPMPVIHPRASVTVVPARVRKALSKLDLASEDLSADAERLFQRIVLGGSDVQARFEEAGSAVAAAMQGLLPHVVDVDPTFERTVYAARAQMEKELGKLRGRVLKREKDNAAALRATLVKARAVLFPGGGMQERALASVYFLSRYGPAFTETLARELSLDTSEHQVVRM